MPKHNPTILSIDTSELLRQARDLPETAGVYHFLNDQEYPVYIGKSINLRQRVQSHLYASNRDIKENKIARATATIRYQTTPGELSALIQESIQVKKYLPLFNRKLRRQKKLFTWKLDEAKTYHSLTLCDAIWPPKQQELYFGLYQSAFQAKKHLSRLAADHLLCKKLLGLESINGASCFGYQLKKCLGACKEIESPTSYNSRLKEALDQGAVNPWPYAGPIGVIEGQSESAYLFDQWKFLGISPVGKLNRQDLINTSEHVLDRDTYKILIGSLCRTNNNLRIVSL